MKWQNTIASLFWLSNVNCDGMVVEDEEGGSLRVVSLSLERNKIQDPVTYDRQRILKRQGTVEANLDNLQTLYFFNASLGTPAQDLRLHLDTGSSDLWVNTPTSSLCEASNGRCGKSGTYNANSSSTYEYLNSRFNISYVDGSSANGDYATDVFQFENIDIKNFQFGIGYTSSSPQGILGIGYPQNEVQAARSGQPPYDNLPARLLADGRIATNAYSIWLDNINSTTGSLLFGGVDKSQYNGNLVTVPVQKAGSSFREFFITMTGLNVGSKVVADNMALAVLLDTGSSLTYLPEDVADSIFKAVNATWLEKPQLAVIPCEAGNSDDTITFQFSKPASIDVPLKELVLPIISQNGRQPRLSDGRTACLFGIFPSAAGAKVLGDTFLRSAYVVYDITNNEISLAQSNFDAKPEGSDVVEIRAGKNRLPNATAARNPVAAKSGLPILGSPASSIQLKVTHLATTLSLMLVFGALFGG
ncbi:hypothetical protein NLG97_g5415 [Lecanicillium saksenae]|uniref:Uncharacterized protein n=1 Tax=Lecanicillium saksenae TaxID=468837 RepID=A0ACC1QSI4_9HYPO|nr:hypothetical protein NLG97_g5415 [Lecanicillium saksenae]